MKFIYVFFILAISVGSIAAQVSPTAASLLEPSKTTFSFSPSIRSSYGETEYDMNINVPGFQLRSLLEYPLDYIMAGGKAELVLNTDRADQYRFEGSYYKSMTDPGGTMFDSDWLDQQMFSYTESDAEVKAVLAQFRLERRFYSQQGTHLALFAGYRYSKIEQDIFGIDGWQLDTLGQRFYFTVPDINALYYEVTYKLPHAGLRVTRGGSQVDLSGSVAYSIALVKDIDDHLLRGKLSTADINGKGLLADVEVKWKMKSGGMKLFLKLTGDLSYIRASGSQTQTWYADEYGWVWDENNNEYVWDIAVPEGTSITGIPHDINLTQYTVGLDLGISF